MSFFRTSRAITLHSKKCASCCDNVAFSRLGYDKTMKQPLTISTLSQSSDPPANFSAVTGNNQVTLSWIDPTYKGRNNATITSYTITTTTTVPPITTTTANASGNTYTMTGLINGNTYVFTITALNSNGNVSNGQTINITLPTTPSAPTALSATVSNQSTTVSFTVPFDGGSAITNYKYSTNNGSTFTAVSPVSTSNSITITGLTNGTTYQILIKAVNSIGDGTASASVSVTPATTPGSVTSVTGKAKNASASISFTAPSSNGGSAITNYKYSIDNGSTFTAFSPTQTTTPVTVSSLTNGTTYQIQLKAVNSVGDGIASTSVSVTPQNLTTLTNSLLFNGTSNYLSLSPGINLGSGAFTLEFWFYKNNSWIAGTQYGIIGAGPDSTSYAMNIIFDSNSSIIFDKNGGGGRPTYTVNSISENAWHHFALTRNNSNLETLFIDGVRAISVTGSLNGTYTDTTNWAATTSIGHNYAGYWNGYITNIRAVVGSNVYDPNSSTITTPIAPLTNVANTKFLSLGANPTTDTTGINTITNVNSVTVSTTEIPF